MGSALKSSILCALAGALAQGCASTRQLVPAASAGSPAPGKALVTVSRSGSIAGGGRAFNVSDNERVVGYVGPGGVLAWERDPGLIIISSWVPDGGGEGKPESVSGATRIVDRLEAGRTYSYGLSLDMMKARGVKIEPGQPLAPPPGRVTVLVHPTIDARADRGLKLEDYGGHFEIAKKAGAGHLTTAFADDWMGRAAYVDRKYVAAGDPAVLALGDVVQPDPGKLAKLNRGGADYLFVAAVRDFRDDFKVLWTIDASVECFLIDLRTGGLVWRGSGSERTTAGAADKGLGRLGRYRSGIPGLIAAIGKDDTLETERDPWLRALAHATRKALGTMPVLKAAGER